MRLPCLPSALCLTTTLVLCTAVHAQQGTIVPGPRNIRDFNPADVSQVVDASDINLRKVYEDLGPDATLWHQHVQTLANPFFEGRAPGTRGGRLAAEYIEFYFREYGLQPAFPSDITETPGGGAELLLTSYTQPFDFPSPSPRVQLISADAAIGDRSLTRGEDFAALGISGNGSVTAPLTFVGYGIESGEDDYTSFDDATDLTGRIAIVMRYEPLTEEGRSRWAPARFSRFSSIAPKLEALARRNAAGVILVNPPGAIDGRTGLETLASSARFGTRMNVPVIQLSHEAADALLASADPQQRDLNTWRRLADEAAIRTVNLRDDVQATIAINLNVEDRLHTHNIAAILPGKGDLADQWIVIGAHYDHVGFGYTGAMPNNVGQLHPGADDNASGTAGMLLAAKRVAHVDATSPDVEHRRSIMFIAFGAEEAGLLGSRHFVRNSSIPSNSIYAMLNMDMIGRLRSNNVLIQGTGSAKEFDDILKPIFQASGLTVSTVPAARGPSDHASFYSAGIPVLFAFTGEHNEYHKPQDRAYTVNPAGAVKIVDLMQAIALELATRPQPLTFQGAPAGGGAGARAAQRVRLGIVPGFNAELDSGIPVDDVSDNTPAADAGILPGDILLRWNDEELTGGAKLTELLGQTRQGDTARITLRRGEQLITVDVTFRRAAGA